MKWNRHDTKSIKILFILLVALKRTNLVFQVHSRKASEWRSFYQQENYRFLFCSLSWLWLKISPGLQRAKITINISLHNKIFSKITCLSRGPLCICKHTEEPKHSNFSGRCLGGRCPARHGNNYSTMIKPDNYPPSILSQEQTRTLFFVMSNMESSMKSFKIERLYHY